MPGPNIYYRILHLSGMLDLQVAEVSIWCGMAATYQTSMVQIGPEYYLEYQRHYGEIKGLVEEVWEW